ncbi:MAG: hypothetical protein AB8H79_25070 [Myxococcota bacterium]
MRYIDRLKKAPPKEAPFLPVLRPADWSLFTVCASRPLLRARPGPGVPLVAVGRPKGDGFNLVKHGSLDELGMRFYELEAFAIQTLCMQQSDWETLHRNEGTGRPTMLGAQDDGVLTASRILDVALLKRAHEIIGSPVLIASVPTQRHLFVCDGSAVSDMSLRRAFSVWVERHMKAAEGVDALADTLFVIREGEPIGTFVLPKEP